jgi:hypothetical protein
MVESQRPGKVMVPLVTEKPPKNPIFFPAILLALQAIFIILLGLHADYGREDVIPLNPIPHVTKGPSIVTYENGTIWVKHETPEARHRGIADFYSMFQDIHIMIFIGFGFLMTFLRKYG